MMVPDQAWVGSTKGLGPGPRSFKAQSSNFVVLKILLMGGWRRGGSRLRRLPGGKRTRDTPPTPLWLYVTETTQHALQNQRIRIIVCWCAFWALPGLGDYHMVCVTDCQANVCTRTEVWVVFGAVPWKTMWGVPHIGGTFLGVPIIRTFAFWGLYWGSPNSGNYHVPWKDCPETRFVPCRSESQASLSLARLRGLWNF